LSEIKLSTVSADYLIDAVIDASTCDEPLGHLVIPGEKRRVSMASYARRVRAQRYEIDW